VHTATLQAQHDRPPYVEHLRQVAPASTTRRATFPFDALHELYVGVRKTKLAAGIVPAGEPDWEDI